MRLNISTIIYVKQNVTKGASTLEQYIKMHPFVRSLCYHPLVLEKLVCSFNSSKFPSCETAVTDMLVCHMILWCIKMEPSHQYLSITKLHQQLSSEH